MEEPPFDEQRIPEPAPPPPEPAPQPAPLAAPEIMPKANAWRELGEVLWLSFPIIVTMLSYTVMQFVDVLMVGQHNETELAAVGSATSCFFLLSSLMMGTLSITNTFVAQCVGRGDRRGGPHYVWQAVRLAVVWGGVSWCLAPLAPLVFRWAGHGADVQAFETVYFQYVLLRIPAVGLWHALAAFYQATKRPAVPMVVALIGNGFNVVGNYALIFGHWGFPEMGIEGAAIATVVGSYLQAGLMLVAFLGTRTDREYGSRSAARFDAAKLWRIIRFGLPAGLTWFLENTSWTLFLLKVIGGLGDDALAANGAAIQIIHLSFMPVVGLNIGVQAIVGQHIGMNDHAGAKRRTYRAMGLAILYMVTMGLIFVLHRHWLIGRFVDPSRSAEAAAHVIRMGSTMLVFGAIFQAFDAVAIVCYGGLKGAGDTRFPMIMTILTSWCVFIPLAFYYTHHLGMGVAGAWLAVTIFVALLGLINFCRFHSEAWRKIDIFAGERRTAPQADEQGRADSD